MSQATKVLDKLYCVHRHPIESHPHCFALGKVRDKTAKKFEKVTGQPWYTYPGYKIGYFDIEVDNLKADYGTMLTWALKEKGEHGTLYTGQVTQEELMTGEEDKRIVEELLDVLENFSIVVGYYSTRFDIPYVRSRALTHGITGLTYGDLYHFDLYYTVRNKFALSRNSLGRACEVFGISNKTHCGFDVWRKAKYGDKGALDEILEYNINDVLITEELHEKVAPFRKWTRRSV
jgi:uncharacterized protein YprB with RNaseH-like and TPR domain